MFESNYIFLHLILVRTNANLIQCRQRDLQGLLINCFSEDANDDIKIEIDFKLFQVI